jgi:hypothetical protein
MAATMAPSSPASAHTMKLRRVSGLRSVDAATVSTTAAGYVYHPIVVGGDDWSRPGKSSAGAVSNEYDRVNDLVDRLLADERFPCYQASPAELEAIRVAIWLRAARPGSALPDPAFLERLGRKLRSQYGELERARDAQIARAHLPREPI